MQIKNICNCLNLKVINKVTTKTYNTVNFVLKVKIFKFFLNLFIRFTVTTHNLYLSHIEI